MADTLSIEERSKRMRSIRAKDTKIEWVVRRILYAQGYRYRVHANELPGKPDIVFRNRRIAIFVHGCFWHQHSECKIAHLPKSRSAYWSDKFKRNVERDKENIRLLQEFGWKVIVVWECETRKAEALKERLVALIGL
jgi:DNA mismatch endonuclease (patch repair protein)